MVRKKKRVFWILVVPVILWGLSELLPLAAGALNRQGVRPGRAEPSTWAGTLILRGKEGKERQTLGALKFPLSRTSDPRFAHEKFDFYMNGLVQVEEAGYYWIGTVSDDGSWLWIDGRLVVDNGGLHAQEERSNWIRLEKGLHVFEIKWENQMGEAYLDFFWVPPQGTRERIPLIPNPWGRISSLLVQAAFFFYKAAQYWMFFALPVVLYPVLFPIRNETRTED